MRIVGPRENWLTGLFPRIMTMRFRYARAVPENAGVLKFARSATYGR
jgi:hypothetical protein